MISRFFHKSRIEFIFFRSLSYNNIAETGDPTLISIIVYIIWKLSISFGNSSVVVQIVDGYYNFLYKKCYISAAKALFAIRRYNNLSIYTIYI